jgi:hypothetical protein
MELIEIDMIELQATQALLHAADDVIARTAARVHACGAGFAKHFGGHHDVFTRHFQILQRLAGNLFRAPFRIDVSGVDKVDARIQRAAHQLFCLRLAQLTTFPTGRLRRRRSWCPGTAQRQTGRYGPVFDNA